MIICANLEFLDQGKQTEFVRVPEWFGPQRPPVRTRVPPETIGSNDKGATETGNGGDVQEYHAREQAWRLRMSQTVGR